MSDGCCCCCYSHCCAEYNCTSIILAQLERCSRLTVVVKRNTKSKCQMLIADSELRARTRKKQQTRSVRLHRLLQLAKENARNGSRSTGRVLLAEFWNRNARLLLCIPLASLRQKDAPSWYIYIYMHLLPLLFIYCIIPRLPRLRSLQPLNKVDQ